MNQPNHWLTADARSSARARHSQRHRQFPKFPKFHRGTHGKTAPLSEKNSNGRRPVPHSAPANRKDIFQPPSRLLVELRRSRAPPLDRGGSRQGDWAI